MHVQDETTDEISLLMKGADTVMSGMVQYNDWLEEECSNMAREGTFARFRNSVFYLVKHSSGLRTLVVAKRVLSSAELEAFDRAYHAAKMSITERSQTMQNCVNRMLEKDLQLLCLTGVEDRLQVMLCFFTCVCWGGGGVVDRFNYVFFSHSYECLSCTSTKQLKSSECSRALLPTCGTIALLHSLLLICSQCN